VVPAALANPSKRTDLVHDIGANLLARQFHRPSAESHGVGKSRVRADRDTVGDAGRHRGRHRPRVTGVETTRDVRRRQHPQDSVVIPESVRAEALADVGDHVDRTY
jgi:hypothetical protein